MIWLANLVHFIHKTIFVLDEEIVASPIFLQCLIFDLKRKLFSRQNCYVMFRDYQSSKMECK